MDGHSYFFHCALALKYSSTLLIFTVIFIIREWIWFSFGYSSLIFDVKIKQWDIYNDVNAKFEIIIFVDINI